ncbi:unnamed protein product [Diplocarpon coronariae]
MAQGRASAEFGSTNGSAFSSDLQHTTLRILENVQLTMGSSTILLSSRRVLLALVSSAVIYGLGLVVYRLFFHPLKHYPGPKLAAATRWYEFYFDLVKGAGGQFAWEIERMHDVYGPIVRINPDELHVRDPDWVDVLYAGNPTHRDKHPPFAAMTGNPEASFGTVDHKIHRKRKLATSPFFSKRSVAAAEPIIRGQAEKLCQSLQDSYARREVVKLHTTYLGFTTDSVSEFAFARPDGLQGNTEGLEDWAETLKMVGESFPLLRQFPWMLKVALKFPLWGYQLVVPAFSRFLELHKEMKSQAGAFLENEKRHPTALAVKRTERPSTVFHGIYHSSLPMEEKSLSRLSQEGLVMIVAGSESTSRTLMMATYYLLTTPSALANLKRELYEAMPDASVVPPVKVLEALPWLHAVIRETFRTSAFFTTRFPLVAPEKLKYRDWVIPPHTPVSMTTRSTMHDPSLFPSPETFIPERWLNGATHNGKDLNRYYIPFSKGTRICPGIELAYAELYMALAMTIRRFDLELYDTVYERDIKVVRDCFLGEAGKNSLGVRVKVFSGECPLICLDTLDSTSPFDSFDVTTQSIAADTSLIQTRMNRERERERESSLETAWRVPTDPEPPTTTAQNMPPRSRGALLLPRREVLQSPVLPMSSTRHRQLRVAGRPRRLETRTSRFKACRVALLPAVRTGRWTREAGHERAAPQARHALPYRAAGPLFGILLFSHGGDQRLSNRESRRAPNPHLHAQSALPDPEKSRASSHVSHEAMTFARDLFPGPCGKATSASGAAPAPASFPPKPRLEACNVPHRRSSNRQAEHRADLCEDDGSVLLFVR